MGCIPLVPRVPHTRATQRNRSQATSNLLSPSSTVSVFGLAQKELKEGGRGARKSAPSHACFFSSLMALRVNIKDLGGSGFDAHTTQLNKKKGLQPPVGASPGELRLWRKLNGLLTDDEKKVDALEHNKAKSRANLAGRPRHSIAPNEGLRRMSEIPSDSAAAPTGAASSGSARRMSTSGSSSPASRSRASSTTTSAHASPRKARPSSPARASPARPRTSAAPAPASRPPATAAASKRPPKARPPVAQVPPPPPPPAAPHLQSATRQTPAMPKPTQNRAKQVAAPEEAEQALAEVEIMPVQEAEEEEAEAEADMTLREAEVAEEEAAVEDEGDDDGEWSEEDDAQAPPPPPPPPQQQQRQRPQGDNSNKHEEWMNELDAAMDKLSKKPAAPPSQPAPASKARAPSPKPVEGGFESMLYALPLGEKKRIRERLNEMIEVEELQNMFDRS